MLPVNFLNAVLPTEGYKCWVEISRNRTTQGFYQTTEELTAKLLEISARGSDAYFACATYKTDRNRRAANAGWMKSLWLDIDCGEGKAYATQKDGIRALDEFCARCSLDIPGVVRSGNGLHAYWVFDRECTSAEWLPLAQRLKLLCAQHGFAADPTRTADAASILRPPGTFNYKTPANPREVAVDDADLFLPLPFTSIDSSLCLNSSISAIKSPLVNTHLPVSNALIGGVHVSFDTDAIVHEGGRNDALHKAVWSFLGKGFSIADTWSMALDYARLKCIPALPSDEARRCVEKSITGYFERNPPKIALQEVLQEPKPKLADDFFWNAASQLCTFIENDAGIKAERVVCEHPIWLEGMTRQENGPRKSAYGFKHYHPIDGWAEFSLTADEVNGNKSYSAFVENGVTVKKGMDKHFKNFVRSMEDTAMQNQIIQYNQMGWKDNYTSFLVGNDLIKPDGAIVKAAGTPKMRQFMDFMRPRGTLEGWQNPATKFTMDGGEPLLGCIVASFASVLMPFCLDEGNGGCIMSIRTEESGFGKTPTVQAVSSVWGEMSACRVTGTYTWNRSQTELVHRRHITQIEEEMPMTDGLVAVKHVKDFTGGTSKGRLNQKGEIVGEPEYFQTIMMSMSNLSLYDLVRSHDEPMSRRIFEINPDAPPAALLDNLGGITREMGRNCGWASRRMLQYLIQPKIMECALFELRGKDIDHIGETQYRYRSLLASLSADRYVVALLSAIDFMSDILNKAHILEFEKARLMNYLVGKAQFVTSAGQLAKLGGIPKPVADLGDFLRAHSTGQITVMAAHRANMKQVPMRMPTTDAVIRSEEATHTMYIIASVINKWCSKNGIDARRMYDALKKLNVLQETVNTTIGAGTGIETGNAPCWKIDTSHPMMTVVTASELTGEKVVKLLK